MPWTLWQVSSDPSAADFVNLLAEAGPTALLIVGFWLLLTGRLVPGRTHDAVVGQRDRLLELAITNARVASHSVAKLEEESSKQQTDDEV
jgi:hypothetical protein